VIRFARRMDASTRPAKSTQPESGISDSWLAAPIQNLMEDNRVC
jgi:hypothetical protein